MRDAYILEEMVKTTFKSLPICPQQTEKSILFLKWLLPVLSAYSSFKSAFDQPSLFPTPASVESVLGTGSIHHPSPRPPSWLQPWIELEPDSELGCLQAAWENASCSQGQPSVASSSPAGRSQARACNPLGHLANVCLFSRMVRIETGIPGQFRNKRAPRGHVLKPREPWSGARGCHLSPVTWLSMSVGVDACSAITSAPSLPPQHLSVQSLLPFSTLPFLRNVYRHLLPIVRNTRPF